MFTRAASGLMALLVAFGCAGAVIAAERVVLAPVADATLIEQSEGALADGAGSQFRVGRTGQPVGSVRRALLRFDIAGSVPRQATITDAALIVQAAPSGAGPRTISLHRVLRRWSEGSSSFAGGQGAPSEQGDVTWIHRSFDRFLWDTPGGDFMVEPSAATVVDSGGSYSWQDAALIDDVRYFRARPSRNHGWIMIGDEESGGTAKKLDSREIAMPRLPPLLMIEFERKNASDDSSSDDDSSSSDDSSGS